MSAKTPVEHYGQPTPEGDAQGGSHIAKVNGNWVCLCGNIAEWDGFQPCTKQGVECEPGVEGWEGFYQCGACGLLIEGDTGVVRLLPSREELLCAAINALNCEYRASLEMPLHVSVYPQAGTSGADSVDALRWAWGFEKNAGGHPHPIKFLLLGNDCHVQRDTQTIPVNASPDYALLANQVLNWMRLHALRRCSFLNDMCERMANHLEANDSWLNGKKLVTEWRGR